MALKECPDCKEQVSDAAPACPKCGRPMPDAKPPKQKLSMKHLVIVALVIIAGVALLRTRHPGTPKAANASPEAIAADMEKSKERLKKRFQKQFAEAGDSGVHAVCTATKLQKDYSTNEVAADQKYRDKWVQVRGQLGSVAKDAFDKPYLVLAADSYGVSQVHASLFDVQVKDVSGNDFTAFKAEDKASLLKPGQQVTVECLGKGAIIGMPRLEQCVIVDDMLKK